MNSSQRARVSNVLVIVGPTAIGKTALTLELAERGPIEIISMDSAQVYRGLNIGTAKPTAEELSAVPHHLIDIRDFWEPYSASEFAADAARLVQEIEKRGRLPVVAGGTFLYFKALRDGLSNLPAADRQIRARLAEEAERTGWPALHDRLKRVDPESAARIKPGDAQRVQRALEVCEITGQPMSAQFARREVVLSANYHVIKLWPQERSQLHQRIERRLGAMFDQGLISECKEIMRHPGFDPDLPALRSVGYRQVISALMGQGDLEEVEKRALYATRQLAKRQLTWLRRVPADQTLDPTDSSARAHAISALSGSIF